MCVCKHTRPSHPSSSRPLPTTTTPCLASPCGHSLTRAHMQLTQVSCSLPRPLLHPLPPTPRSPQVPCSLPPFAPSQPPPPYFPLTQVPAARPCTAASDLPLAGTAHQAVIVGRRGDSTQGCACVHVCMEGQPTPCQACQEGARAQCTGRERPPHQPQHLQLVTYLSCRADCNSTHATWRAPHSGPNGTTANPALAEL